VLNTEADRTIRIESTAGSSGSLKQGFLSRQPEAQMQFQTRLQFRNPAWCRRARTKKRRDVCAIRAKKKHCHLRDLPPSPGITSAAQKSFRYRGIKTQAAGKGIFTPELYRPEMEMDLYVELTTRKQELVTTREKNRKN